MGKTIFVAFHIGRGGRFHNQGHKSFYGECSLQDIIRDEDLFMVNEDEDGNELPDEEWMVHDGSGNAILKGRDKVTSDTGVLDIDGEYDTYVVYSIDDLDQDDFDMLYDAHMQGEQMSDELIDAIMESQGFERI